MWFDEPYEIDDCSFDGSERGSQTHRYVCSHRRLFPSFPSFPLSRLALVSHGHTIAVSPDNWAEWGGAVYSDGYATVTNSNFSGDDDYSKGEG